HALMCCAASAALTASTASAATTCYTAAAVATRIFCGSGRDVVYADRGDRVARDCELVRRSR
ncbi:MAG TPA: hypothetical protein VG144_02650, partial [Gaiellaceae bacterium]|nr:hypothetical protein [Gaiellaceae bacterium]